MTQDVQQWLAEIQSLQQRLDHVSQERATAYEQLSRWQRSYQTEAQQRRKDIRRLQTVIYHLDQENQRLKQQLGQPLDIRPPIFMSNELMSKEPGTEDGVPPSHSPESGQDSGQDSSQPFQAQGGPSTQASLVDQGSSLLQQTQIHQKLKEAITECDRLSKALSQEQAEHEQTRQTLMTALGDTVEQLERERKRHDPSKRQPPLPAGKSNTEMTPEMAQRHSERRITPQQIATTPPLPEPQQKQLASAPPPYPEAGP